MHREKKCVHYFDVTSLPIVVEKVFSIVFRQLAKSTLASWWCHLPWYDSCFTYFVIHASLTRSALTLTTLAAQVFDYLPEKDTLSIIIEPSESGDAQEPTCFL